MNAHAAYTIEVDSNDVATFRVSYADFDDASEDVSLSFPLTVFELLDLAWRAIKTAFYVKVPAARPR